MSGNMLDGKVILVTGAGNGIGAEIAELAAGGDAVPGFHSIAAWDSGSCDVFTWDPF